MKTDIFSKEISSHIAEITAKQCEKITEAAAIVADVTEKDGIVYAFGCGHSHLVALDCFYRAGGAANVSAVLDTDLMLHNGAAKSSAMERMEDIAPELFRRYNIGKNDCLFVISASGINGVPVGMALQARKCGIRTVAITSSQYFDEKARHSSGLHLYEASDLYIDSLVPHGDAAVEIGSARMGSLSTILGSFILQSVIMEAAEMCIERNVEMPVYKSGNVDGGTEYNRHLIDRFIPRVKHL